MGRERARRRPRWTWLAGALAVGLGAVACDQELPTQVGGDLLPDAAVATYELILPASEFLESDTAISGFGIGARSAALIVARDYLGELDANALAKFSAFPGRFTYTADSVTVTDSTPTYIGGEVVVRIDTTALGLDEAGTDTTIGFQLHSVAEAWDARSTSWTVRSAVGGDTLLWSEPGGTRGALLDSARWVRGDSVAGDTLIFPIDSATVAAWSDTSSAQGVLLSTEDAGVRARVGVLQLRLFVRPTEHPDTVVSTATGVRSQAYVYQPEPSEPDGVLRVGGNEGWRSFLVFQDSLWDRVLPCPEGPGCAIRLADATINRAELLLNADAVAAIHQPLTPFSLEARPVRGSSDVPLARAPLADTVGVASGLAASAFAAPADTVVTLSVGGYVRTLLAGPPDSDIAERRVLALTAIPDQLPFGFGSFEGVAGANAPMLRLVVTVDPAVEP